MRTLTNNEQLAVCGGTEIVVTQQPSGQIVFSERVTGPVDFAITSALVAFSMRFGLPVPGATVEALAEYLLQQKE